MRRRFNTPWPEAWDGAMFGIVIQSGFIGWRLWSHHYVAAAIHGMVIGLVILIVYFLTAYERKARGSNRSTTSRRRHPQAQTAFNPADTFHRAVAHVALDAVRTALGTGTRAYEGPRLGRLPYSKEDLPILAVRKAGLAMVNGKLEFMSVATDFTFGLDADAKCRFSRHKAPEPECECGFYAAPADKISHFGYEGVTLQVELSGRVIIADLGYRAEHQRVVGVLLPPCRMCGGEATGVWVEAASSRLSTWRHSPNMKIDHRHKSFCQPSHRYMYFEAERVSAARLQRELGVQVTIEPGY